MWPGDCKMNFTICFKQGNFFFENEMEKELNFCLRKKVLVVEKKAVSIRN